MNSVVAALKNYAVLQGRSSRREFWSFALFQLLSMIVAAAIDAALDDSGLFNALALLALSVPALAVAVRRLHDTDRSGWWYLIGLIPVAGFVALIVFWLQPGSPGANRFGSPPLGGAPLA